MLPLALGLKRGVQRTLGKLFPLLGSQQSPDPIHCVILLLPNALILNSFVRFFSSPWPGCLLYGIFCIYFSLVISFVLVILHSLWDYLFNVCLLYYPVHSMRVESSHFCSYYTPRSWLSACTTVGVQWVSEDWTNPWVDSMMFSLFWLSYWVPDNSCANF